MEMWNGAMEGKKGGRDVRGGKTHLRDGSDEELALLLVVRFWRFGGGGSGWVVGGHCLFILLSRNPVEGD